MNKVLARKVKNIEIGREMKIEWRDNKISRIPFSELRYLCPCASCVDELTNIRQIKRTDIKSNIKPITSEYVGNYAIRIFWNDGHNTGIYTFRSLRETFEAESADKNTNPIKI